MLSDESNAISDAASTNKFLTIGNVSLLFPLWKIFSTSTSISKEKKKEKRRKRLIRIDVRSKRRERNENIARRKEINEITLIRASAVPLRRVESPTRYHCIFSFAFFQNPARRLIALGARRASYPRTEKLCASVQRIVRQIPHRFAAPTTWRIRINVIWDRRAAREGRILE